MAPRKCCCEACLIASDDFNRADGDPGAGWSGSGVIVSNTLEANNDTTTVCSPKPLGSFYGQCKLIGTTDGAVYIIKPGDPTGGYLVTATFTGTAGTGTYNIEVTNGTDTENYDFDWDSEDETIKICYQPGVQLTAGPSTRAIVNSGEAQWVTVCIDTTHDDCWPGDLGNWTFVSGTFDDWLYEVHWIENHTCQNCDCFCTEDGDSYHCIPKTLYLTITSTECPDINGTYTMLQKVVLGSSLTDYPTLADWPQKRYWVSEEIACPEQTTDVHALVFILECQTNVLQTQYPSFELTAMRYGTGAFDCSNLRFDALDPDTTDTGGDEPQQITKAMAKSTSTCSPFSLDFPTLCEGEFQCSTSTACCGGYLTSGGPGDPPDPPGFESDPSCFTIVITE